MPITKKIIAADIVKEAEQILKECRAFRGSKKRVLTDEEHKELHKKMVTDHHDFASIYMLPLRSIVYTNELYSDVMEKYVNHLSKNPWDTRREFIERQADYLVFLYRKKNKRHGSKDVAIYKDSVVRQLVEEDESMKKYEKEVKETVEAEFDQIVDQRRDRIHARLVQMKKDREEGKVVDEEKQKEEISALMREMNDATEMKQLLNTKDNVK
jgi:hypothetical protein